MVAYITTLLAQQHPQALSGLVCTCTDATLLWICATTQPGCLTVHCVSVEKSQLSVSTASSVNVLG